MVGFDLWISHAVIWHTINIRHIAASNTSLEFSFIARIDVNSHVILAAAAADDAAAVQ